MTGRRGGNNNAIINMTGWGKGDARETELQDRKVVRVWINTGPEGDTRLGLILGGALFYARVTFETLIVFNFKVP